MIIFESVFFGVKSLMIGIPISLVIVYLVSYVMSDMSTTGFVFPFVPILISMLSVFFIVLLTMRYATSKIRHDNILDAIREENI
jgi:putative ABC transport system permease protein